LLGRPLVARRDSARTVVSMSGQTARFTGLSDPPTMTMDVGAARAGLNARNDPRHVVADPDASYFGTTLTNSSLLAGEHAQLGETRFEDWLATAS
jgi:hypothetical protein